MSTSGISHILNEAYIDTFVQRACILKNIDATEYPDLVSGIRAYLTSKFDSFIVDQLNDADLIELIEKKGKASPQEIQTFVESKIPALNDALEKLLTEFIQQKLA